MIESRAISNEQLMQLPQAKPAHQAAPERTVADKAEAPREAPMTVARSGEREMHHVPGADGADRTALPQIVTLRQFAKDPPPPPPLIIDGILHQGCKMILGGISKSNKSWCLLDLALSVASGEKWWGRGCSKVPVVYINFELPPWAIAQRIDALCAARPGCQDYEDALHLWNLRGHNADLTTLRPKLEEQLINRKFGLVILDPAYKVLGARDENANGEIANLMNELENLAQSSEAAVIVAHHFAKGNSTVKEPEDRLSGAGAWVRDPDSIIVLTPHEESGCFTVTSILRNLPQLPEFVVGWEFPLMRLAPDLDPGALRRPQSKNKRCTDRQFMDAVLTDEPKSFGNVVNDAVNTLGLSRRTTANYLKRLTASGLVLVSNGAYRIADHFNQQRVGPMTEQRYSRRRCDQRAITAAQPRSRTARAGQAAGGSAGNCPSDV